MKHLIYVLASRLIASEWTSLLTSAQSTYELFTFTTLAGKDRARPDGTGSNARFTNSRGVAVDSAGNVRVADPANNTIRRGSAALFILKSGFEGRKFVFEVTGQIGRSVTLETSTD